MLWKNNQYPWNSEVESIWISLIGWSLRTSISYTFTSLVHHILCIVKHVGMEIIAFTVTSKQTLYALNHYVLLSVLPKVFTQKNHSCRVRMDSFLHRRRSGDNGIKNGFLFDIQTRIKTEAYSRVWNKRTPLNKRSPLENLAKRIIVAPFFTLYYEVRNKAVAPGKKSKNQ